MIQTDLNVGAETFTRNMATDRNGWGRRAFLRATGAVGTAVAATGVASGVSATGATDERDHLVVVTDAAADQASVAASVRDSLPDGTRVVRRNETLNYVVAELPGGVDSTAAADAAATAGVKSVEERTLHAATADSPRDPLRTDQYAPQMIDAPRAWEVTEGCPQVTIAIVDNGVAYDHPDLVDRFGEVKGRDVVDGDDDPSPDDSSESHGTHVAGLAAATTNNGTGVAGISDSRLLSVRVLDENGQGSVDDIADGIRWAADNGADVINLGFAGARSDVLKNAVSYAAARGALLVGSAGNRASRGVEYPAAYDECLAVSALNENGALASFSSYGDGVDVAAPGANLVSTWPESGDGFDGKYAELSGGGLATGIVSGVAGLALAVNQRLSPEDLREQLKQSAVDVDLPEEEQGAGRIDAANALPIVADETSAAICDESPTPPNARFSLDEDRVEVGTEVTVDASDSDDPDGSIERYEWAFGDDTTATGETAAHAYDDAGEYTVTLTLTDDDGATGTASRSVTVTDRPACGDSEAEAEVDDRLYGWWDGDTYTYESDLDDPCSMVVALDGPENADFDLYLTTDGSTPTPRSYDRRSVTPDSNERIVLEDVTPGQRVGIRVDAYAGSGAYRLFVAERGR